LKTNFRFCCLSLFSCQITILPFAVAKEKTESSDLANRHLVANQSAITVFSLPLVVKIGFESDLWIFFIAQ